MADVLKFETRAEFREWLEKNCTSHDAIWIEISKDKASKSLTAREALEEALCFGWLDSLIQRIDDKRYKKYFAPRRRKSPWSRLNKTIVESLETGGKMTDHGRLKVEEAKQNGMWEAADGAPITEEHVQVLVDKLVGREPAHSNFMAMSDSVKGAYAAHYSAAKAEETRSRRLEKIITRLNDNLKPM